MNTNKTLHQAAANHARKAWPNVTGLICDYEEGLLDEEQILDLFQLLVDTGLAWQLQGHYGRTAADLINRGYISPPEA